LLLPFELFGSRSPEKTKASCKISCFPGHHSELPSHLLRSGNADEDTMQDNLGAHVGRHAML
jgi:hypothetical protein